MRKLFLKLSLLILSLSLFVLSCEKETKGIYTHEPASSNGMGYVSPAMVLKWNDAATYAVLGTLQLQPTPRIPPFRESHYYAMMNLAMHDALNNIFPK
jgi:hypothetical protein